MKIDLAKRMRTMVKNHCMAFRVDETDAHIFILFPEGYRLRGARVTKANGVIWACEQALRKMEETWRDDTPWNLA